MSCSSGCHVFPADLAGWCECGQRRMESPVDPWTELVRRQVWLCAYVAESVLSQVWECSDEQARSNAMDAADRTLADFDARFEVQR